MRGFSLHGEYQPIYEGSTPYAESARKRLDQPPTAGKRTVHFAHHAFGPQLECKCGKSWQSQQDNPTVCPDLVSVKNKDPGKGAKLKVSAREGDRMLQMSDTGINPHEIARQLDCGYDSSLVSNALTRARNKREADKIRKAQERAANA